MAGKPTRTFRNFHHPKVRESDYAGQRTIIDNRFKLVLRGKEGDLKRELFDLRADPAEEKNLLAEKTEVADAMYGQLRDWQYSVLQSLTGADYSPTNDGTK